MRNIVADPRYKFVDLQPQINQAGYDLLEADQVDEARCVFELNTELYPHSANAWDSLAEWHYRQKNCETALELYRKASGLDPDGPIGDNSRQMLQRIQQTERQ